MDKKDELKELFASNLANWQQNPPAHVWDAVNRQLIWKSRRRLILYSLSAAAVLILMLVPLGMWIWKTETNPQQELAETIVMEQSSDNIMLNGQNVRMPNPDTKSQQYFESPIHAGVQPQSTSQTTGNNPVDFSASAIMVEKIETNPVVIAENTNEIQEDEWPKIADEDCASVNEANKSYQRAAMASRMLRQADDEILEQQKNRDKLVAERMNLVLAYGSVPGGTVSASELLYENSNVRYRPDNYQSDMAYETSFYEEIERTDVQTPLSFGLKISYQAGRRLFLETGISYTSLGVVSKTKDFDAAYTKYFRTIHYLGIPLGIRWELLQTSPFKAYLMQSVMFEKGLKVANRKNRFEHSDLVSSDLSTSSIPGFQLSTLSSFGVDLRIYHNFSLFGEGGVQVFYLNRTQPFNMRSAKMAWPVFQTGIRMNF